VPVFVAVFFIPFSGHRLVAVGVFAFAALSDFLDGYLARKWKMVTDLGKFLDPVADKVLVACALIAVSVVPIQHVFSDYFLQPVGIRYIFTPDIFQILVAVFSMVILARELMIGGFRAVLSGKNVVLAADRLGKVKTVFQMLSLLFLIPVTSIFALDITLHFGTVSFGLHDIFYFCGLLFLAIATVLTIISGINYLVKNWRFLDSGEAKTEKEATE